MSNELSGGAPAPGTRGRAPRTLAEDLRGRDDRSLTALLRGRPDLLSPVPGDLTQLATRAGTRASVVRAVERLDRFALQTAEALAVAPDPCPYPTLASLLREERTDGGPSGTQAPGTEPSSTQAPGTEPSSTRAPDAAARERPEESPLDRALGTLREQALLWGDPARPRLVRTARELLAPSPTTPSETGLGPTLAEAASGTSPGRLQELLATAGLSRTGDPVSAATALTELFEDRERMAALLRTAPEESLKLLGKLEWGPPYGTVDLDAPSSPVAWLLDRGLLVPAGQRTVVLPREVALHLRDGRAHRVVEPWPPEVRPRRTHPPNTVDATGAGQALAALSTIEELLASLETEPPAVLRAGGLGVRDLKRAAHTLEAPEPTAAFWLELAYAAGLLASDGEADERYAPTPAYDDWLREPPEERWARLASAWLAGTRLARLAGERDAKGRALSPLGGGLDRALAPEVRRRTLRLLEELEPGAAPVPESVLDRLAWEQPLRGGAPRGPASTAAQPPWQSPPHTAPHPATGTGTDSGTAATARTRPGTRPGTEAPPQESDLRSRIAHWTLEEAELLGLTGRGALTSYASQLLTATAETSEAHAEGEPEPAVEAPGAAAGTETGASTGARSGRGTGREPEHQWRTAPGGRGRPPEGQDRGAAGPQLRRVTRALAPLLPEPLDHVLLQADLTAVAPGPLTRELADALGVLAEVESKGGATVYRFTPASVRRALDTGRSASDLHSFLTAHSRTPVPQPLTYLIDDVARKHGQLRVGAASSYLRCDDDALLTGLLNDRRSASLRLRSLAPTVLASSAPPDQLLAALREMGYAPAAESAEGDVLITRADTHRSPPRTAPEPVADGPRAPSPALLSAAVRAIRAGDHAATAPRSRAGAQNPEPSPPSGHPGPATPSGTADGASNPGSAETPAASAETPTAESPATGAAGEPTAGRSAGSRKAPGRKTSGRRTAGPTGAERTAKPPRTTSAETLATMQSAAMTGTRLWMGYVNANGAASQRVIDPVRVEGGFVTAYDHTAGEVRTYPLHRVTGIAELTDE